MTQSIEMNVDQRWSRVQAISGLVFALFVATHLANTLLALGGPSAYDGFQRTVQAIYQHPVAEIFLLGVILPAHITAGFIRSRIRRRRGESRSPTVIRLHRYSGWFLVAVIYWHAAAVRLPSLLYDVWPRFEGVAFSIEWMPMWFYPYYFLLAWAGLFHGANGTGLAFTRLGMTRGPLRVAHLQVIGWVGASAIAMSLLAFGGVWFDVGVPMESDYGRLYLSHVG